MASEPVSSVMFIIWLLRFGFLSAFVLEVLALGDSSLFHSTIGFLLSTET